jgi:glycosyltransferase involved in cell wall biosynthesis
MKTYGALAARELSRLRTPCTVYHFRAGFGNASIERAREMGMVTLCDHSAVHPRVIEGLLAADGRPGNAGLPRRSGPKHPVWKQMLGDIDGADAVVVNSAFVKEMFIRLGWPPERIHVVYLGVDDRFLEQARLREQSRKGGTLRLMFAGRFERAKGAAVLIEALQNLADVDWEFVVAGPVAKDIRAGYPQFFEAKRVTLLGTIHRTELAKQMSASDVFVFPSFAEGSARAAFEALACGCYVITTPNSGTIVEDGVHGTLVPSGDRDGLAQAIARVSEDRQTMVEIGNRNVEVVSTRFRQRDYGDAMANLYRKLENIGLRS